MLAGRFRIVRTIGSVAKFGYVSASNMYVYALLSDVNPNVSA